MIGMEGTVVKSFSTYAAPGGERPFANGRIICFVKFSRPSSNIDSACSEKLAAVYAACSALKAGEANTVIADNLNVINNPDNSSILGKGTFGPRQASARSIVIKGLEDAEADNHNIIAIILGGATNHLADAIFITHPRAGSRKDNFNQTMHDAGGNPFDVSYIELHGTGTQAGDAEESGSVANVFAPIMPRRRKDQRLQFSAVKSNIGRLQPKQRPSSLYRVSK
ncbi:hypothetical protein MMC07_001630 [Pseudocyphellaria aurata]|nr:hypothetical protein [Pseudocyphellaria aurata]